MCSGRESQTGFCELLRYSSLAAPPLPKNRRVASRKSKHICCENLPQKYLNKYERLNKIICVSLLNTVPTVTDHTAFSGQERAKLRVFHVVITMQKTRNLAPQ